MAIYTQLSVLALPGGRHTFVAKGVVPPSPRGSDLFTELSVLALPGGRHTFVAKGVAIPIPVPVPDAIIAGGGGGGVSGRIQEDLYRWRIRDDEEIIDIIMAIVLSGRLG